MSGQLPEDARTVARLVQKLESLHRAGVNQLRRVPVSEPAKPAERHHVVPASVAQVESPQTETQVDLGGAKPMSPAKPPTERVSELQVLAQEVAACQKCNELAASRTQTVFGVGNPHARLCFFGEAPGADEDRQGEPFVGRAGQLLTKIIEACTLRREDVYILNVLKCRPPGNRNPSAEESENCRCFFERQLEIIQPEFICCLGTVAATTLLETNQSIGKLRGAFHDWRGTKVLATYHPAYLLRNPSAKRYVWDDMKLLMKEMGVTIPT